MKYLVWIKMPYDFVKDVSTEILGEKLKNCRFFSQKKKPVLSYSYDKTGYMKERTAYNFKRYLIASALSMQQPG
jgi:hypothetical protein